MVKDMTTDRVFVLLMMVLLMMAGCFEATSTTEAEEEQDSTSGDDSTDSSTPNGGNTATNSQERIWYSSGNAVNSHWNDGQDVRTGSSRCLEYGPSYDSNTGEYVGEECKETGYPNEFSDWNNSMCNQRGGVLTNTPNSPRCTVVGTSISTNPGEALLVYEMQEITITSMCNGVLSSTIDQVSSYNAGNEYVIVPGSALSCTHEISYEQYYDELSDYDPNSMKIWSIVYALQDTVVV